MKNANVWIKSDNVQTQSWNTTYSFFNFSEIRFDFESKYSILEKQLDHFQIRGESGQTHTIPHHNRFDRGTSLNWPGWNN